MSISIDPTSAGTGLQHVQTNQKITQTQTKESALGTAFNARTASAPDNTSATPAAKAAVDVKNGEAAKVSVAQTEQSLQEINKVLATLSVSVQFQIDPSYKDVIVKVVDQESGKVIRQIPSEDVVRISKAMDNLKGLLFAQSV